MEQQETRDAVVSWGAISAAACFAGGIVAGLLGSAFTAGTWIWGSDPHPWLRGFGTFLLILTIPLLIGAGHCLDWMEREKDKQRREASGRETR